MASKGKAVMTGEKGSSGKRKRTNRDVLQFFEDAADEIDGDDGSDWSDFFDEDFLGDFMEDPKVRSAPEKSDHVPLFPKEEELSGDELEKMLEERYRSGSGFVRYAEDDYDTKRSVDKNFFMPSVVEPTIWKVKCKVGREKNVVFCLIQKYVDLKVLGTKLQIISTFAVEHIKGFVFVEAEKQSDVTEACYQLADVYCTLVAQVPSNEIGQLLNVRRKNNEVKEGTWARVKNGIYRGDLTQVVAVNNERKRATVKLIPRIDMQALMEKYGGGSRLKKQKNGVPAARLISSRDLEEFRPLMQYRRDRDTGKSFEFLDGLMLKDGFLFKKMSIDSLAFWDVNPTEDELQKYALPIHDESDNVEWLSQLYGEKKKKCEVKIGKGGGKGEGSSGSNEPSGFEVHDLVLFGKREFGMVIGMDKDEKYKILKDDSEGPVTLTFGQKELKYVPIDKKFTAPDHRMKTISINDTVRILDGPSKDKQGIVKQIYRGIVFVYDENDLENAYFCSKSKMSEKIKHPDASCHGKDGGLSTFEDVPSSPKSPLSPRKPWQIRENGSDDRSDKGAIFSVGQSLRIRVGPLKGYLCRVLAVRYSDVTVKLDSQQRVLTVKPEHLSEVRGKNSSASMSDASGLESSFKPFDLLGADNSTNDWLGASGSADGDGWKVGTSNERSTWSAVSSWGSSVQEGTAATTLPASVDNDSEKEDSAWLTKVNSNQNSNTDAAWGKHYGADASNSWGKANDSVGDHAGSNSWGKAKDPVSDHAGASNSWGKAKDPVGDHAGASNSWGKAKDPVGDHAGASNSWGKAKDPVGDHAGASNSWGKAKEPSADAWTEAKPSTDLAEDSWGKAAGCFKSSSVENKGCGTSSGSPACGSKGWGKGKEGNTEAGWGDAGGQKGGDDGGQVKTDSWKPRSFGDDGASALSGGKKGGDGWQGKSWDKESGNTGGGNGSWQSSGNSENDQGFDSGRGSGGMGRGGFGRGRDYGGRGRGRSDNRDQVPSWRSEGQGGSSWGKNSSSGNDGGDNRNAGGWSQKGQDSANNEQSGNKSWGSAGGWSQKGQDSATNEPTGNKSKAAEGGSSWGRPPKGGREAGGGGSWGKSQLEEGQNKAGDGGSSWGGGNEKASEKRESEVPGNPNLNSAEGGSSWGQAKSGGSSWGNAQASGNSGGGGWGN